MNTATAFDPAALGEFEQILADAFAILTGQEDLNAIIEPGLGINLYRDLGSKFDRIKDLVHALREQVEAEGPERLRCCVTAFYVALPGNEPLRLWVARHLPDCAALVAEETFRAARSVYLESRRSGQQKLAISGFETLKEASGVEAVAREIAGFRDKLKEATRQLRRLNGYKQLHDNLHVIQTQALARFSRILLKPAFDEYDVMELHEQHGLLTTQVPKAHASIDMFLDGEDEAEEEAWLPDLDGAIAAMDKGDLADPETLRAVAYELRGVLRMQLPRLNRHLTLAARAIPFDDLSDLLRRAEAHAAADSPMRGRLEDAAVAFDSIAASLARMVSAHDGWQDIDTALWAMEAAVRTAGDRASRLELVGIWRNALSRVATLEKLDPDGVAALRAAEEGFKGAIAIAEEDPSRLASTFQLYAGAVRLQFFRIDTALLNQCAAVGRLEPTLKALVEGD